MVLTEKNSNVTIIQIDHPPVNALSSDVAESLRTAIGAAEQDDTVHAIVVMGAGKTFVVGADIKQLEELAWGRGAGPPHLHALLLQIEDCTKPIVMAIHGAALGGGLELAMSGHYRVATRDAQVGQPEVNLGIIPGAEGTQRLPRLAGVEKAIEMCVTGKPTKAPDALTAGILDVIVDGDLKIEAVSFARRVADQGPHRRTRERVAEIRSRSSLQDAVAVGRDLAARTKKHLTAPLKAIDAIAASVSMPFDQGCAREQELFAECVNSQQCRALIHVFFAERAVTSVPGLSKGTASTPFGQIAIVGAGTMGTGIAMACANAGLKVLLKDSRPEALETGLAAIGKSYEISAKRGRFSAEEIAERIGRIRLQLDYADFENADLAVEAVFENMELKRKVFRELDAVLNPDAILATNTSTLDIDDLARCTGRPASVMGLHFFSPANVMRLLEIVRGRATAPETIAAGLGFAKRLSKVGVVVGNCPGFVGNRMMFPYMYEAQFLVEEGATPEQVDAALRRFGMAMGIFEVDDMAGIDVAWRVRRELGHFSEAELRRPLVSDRLYDMGRLGQKTGKGWYTYADDRKPIPDPEVVGLIRSLARESGIPQRQFREEDIVERSLYGMINEGARALEEGYALRASDIDTIYVNGYGFPGWRGGPMFYADSVSLSKIVERISVFEQECGPRWKVAPLLQQLAATGKTFREFDEERNV